MQIIRNDLNPCTVELKIICNSDTVKAGFQKAYKDFAKDKKRTPPKFRPGKAPLHMVKKMVSKDEAMRSAADHIANDVSKKAIIEQGLEAFENPHVSINSIDEENSTCELTIKVPLAPIVKLSNYKDLKTEKKSVEVSDEEFEQAVQTIQRQFGERKMVENRESQNEDFAMIKLKTDQNKDPKPFMIMIGQSFNGLNKALIGMRVGENKKVVLDFPESIQDKNLSGKTVDCEIFLESLSSLVLPNITDDFVQNIKDPKLKSENVNQFKEKLRLEVQNNKEKENNNAFAEELLTNLMESSTVHIPDTLWETVVEHRIKEIAYTAQKNNISVESLIQQESGQSNIEVFVENLKKDAKVQVERAIVAREIFTKENLQINENDMTEALLEMCKDYNVDLKTLYENLQRSNRMHEAQFRAIFGKVLQFLNETANLKKQDNK